MKTKQYRQGDIWIEQVESLPKGLKKRASKTILYGSQTGHSHFLKSGTVFDGKKGSVYLDIPKATQLLHDSDHDPINLPKGFYQVIRQREYLNKDAIRLVID